MKKFIILLVTVLFMVIGLRAGIAGATTGDNNEEPCVPQDAWTETVVVEEAWTEYVEHPAVTHEEEVFDHWQRYSWTGGPRESNDPPPFPSDDWQPNVKGDPHGVGVEGAYYRSHGGSGKGDWFYLEAVTKTVTVVDQEAWVEEIEHPAVTEEIEHPAVECPPVEEPCPDDSLIFNPETGTCDPVEEPETPEEPQEPQEPQEPKNPEVPQVPTSTSSQSAECLAGALVTVTMDAQGNTSKSIENGHPSCPQQTATGEAFQEEGL